MAATLWRARIRVLEAPLTIAVLVLAWIAAIALVDPRAEVPLIDDWVYAASVQALLAGKGLVISSWSSTFPAVQIAWGALVAALAGGFSLTALRVSTLVLALLGTLAFAGILSTLGCRPAHVLLGALAWMFYPVAFVLSFTFMTDVPFVSVMNGSLLCYVRWTKRGHTHDLALGSALAVVAFLIRQLGAALALAPIGYVLLMRLVGGPRRILTWPQRLCLLMPFVGLGLTLGWIRGVHGETRVYQERVEDLSFIWSTSGWIYLREFLHVILHLGLVLWPLTWGTVRSLSLRALTWATGTMAILCGLYLWHQGELPRPLGHVLTWDELGMGRTLIAGPLPDRPWLVWPQRLVLGISLSGAVVLVAAAAFATALPASSAYAAGSVTATFTKTSDWGTGYEAKYTITNGTTTATTYPESDRAKLSDTGK